MSNYKRTFLEAVSFLSIIMLLALLMKYDGLSSEFAIESQQRTSTTEPIISLYCIRS